MEDRIKHIAYKGQHELQNKISNTECFLCDAAFRNMFSFVLQLSHDI